MEYHEDYPNFHPELLAFVSKYFSDVEVGLQWDSYIWIKDGEEKVAIDTFTSMKHQIKSPKAGPHVQKVIATLRIKYKVKMYDEPELEGHEGY
ncbi:hypothetical protein AGMMS50256_12930 [Betaproteobacteria bacterium]|nr:hypothetical protein AGMMS50256_12930 [Betaproteobacteria bacterium]